MAFEVIALVRDGTKIVHRWQELDGTESSANWRQLSLCQVQRAHGGLSDHVDIFLLAGGASSRDWYNPPFLQELLRKARDHSWGARVFLVLEHADSEKLRDLREILEVWLDTALENGVTDILTLGIDTTLALEDRLRRACVETKQRRQLLLKPSARRPWRCVVPPAWRLPEEILGSSLTQLCWEGAPIHRVVLITKPSPTDQELELRAVFETTAATTAQQVVAVLRWPVSAELQRACAAFGLAPPVRLFSLLELWYLLLQLNQAAVDSEPVGREAEVEVPRDKEPVFIKTRQTRGATVLVTHSFNPDKKSEHVHCLQACEDFGRLLRGAPAGVRYDRLLATHCTGLTEHVRGDAEITIWVHMGHGSPGGLQQARQWDVVSPERWLNCFPRGRHPLRLALFLACQSTAIARRFAAAGADVAIGFDNPVLTDACRHLAVEVMARAVRSGGDRNMILDGFREGCRRLLAHGSGASRPVAFYPK